MKVEKTRREPTLRNDRIQKTQRTAESGKPDPDAEKT